MQADHEHPGGGSARQPFTAVDVVLAVATLPLLLFVLMFVTSGTTGLLDDAARRRRLGLALLAVEAALAAAIVIGVSR